MCLGSIYAWSFFQTALREGVYTWDALWTQLPFAAGLASFASFMIFAGRWQDRSGPKKVATLGGVLLGIGYILAFLVTFIPASDATLGTIWLILTYGIVGGAGIGFAYVCPIAALVKWFPEKKGTMTGVAVAGFGAGALVFGYVEQFLLDYFSAPTQHTIGNAFLVLGVVYLVVVVLGARLLTSCPAGWLPPGFVPPAKTADGMGISIMPGQMIHTGRFWLLWVMFALAATAGLMVIGNVKSAAIAIDPAAAVVAPIIVGVMSLLNAAGRIVWGAVSDRIGRENTMLLMYLVLVAAMFTFAWISLASNAWTVVMVIASIIGFCFGGNFALFPSATAEFFGSANVGKNYGVLFTSYGVAGITGGLVAGFMVSLTGSYFMAFTITGVMALIAAILTFALRLVRKSELK
jgi:OFA family oxalate/formate antiporter-like MFS transporter